MAVILRPSKDVLHPEKILVNRERGTLANMAHVQHGFFVCQFLVAGWQDSAHVSDGGISAYED